MNKKIIALAAILFCAMAVGLFAEDSSSAKNEGQTVEQKANNSQAIKYVAAGGIAVGKIGSAAMGAMSENAELSGKALPFVGLAEGICLWGFLVALLIIIL